MNTTLVACGTQAETAGYYLRWAALILLQAAKDAQAARNPRLAAGARRWIMETGVDWAEALGLDPEVVKDWVMGLPPLRSC